MIISFCKCESDWVVLAHWQQYNNNDDIWEFVRVSNHKVLDLFPPLCLVFTQTTNTVLQVVQNRMLSVWKHEFALRLFGFSEIFQKMFWHRRERESTGVNNKINDSWITSSFKVLVRFILPHCNAVMTYWETITEPLLILSVTHLTTTMSQKGLIL